MRGSSWQSLVRWVGLFLLLAFLQFVTYNVLESLEALRSRSDVVFLVSATLLAAGAMIAAFNLLVFVADEFQVGTDSNDFELLLSLPIGFATIVWTKVLLRSAFDLVGLSLMLPVLVAAALALDVPVLVWPVLYVVYFGVEVLAGLCAVVVFFLLARLLSPARLEALRLLAGFSLPFLAGAILRLKDRLADPASVEAARVGTQGLMEWLPLHWMVSGLASSGSAGPARFLAGLAGLLAIAAAAHVALARMQALATSLGPVHESQDSHPIWRSLFRGSRRPLAALTVKDLAMILRRRVTFITVAVLPLGIVAVNVSTISAGSIGRQAFSPEVLTLTSMIVPLLFLPYMTAAQSFGQIEYARIPFLQALPIPARRLLLAKAIFWLPAVFGLSETVHLAFLVSYGRFEPSSFAVSSVWVLAASTIVTCLAVGVAALFPVSENALFKQQGATLTMASLLYLTGSIGGVALVFPLTLTNRLALLAVSAGLAHYLLDLAARRIEYFEEESLLTTRRGLDFGESFVLFDVYIGLYLLANAGIALLPGVDAATEKLLVVVALLGTHATLAWVSAGYLRARGFGLAALWEGAGRGWRALASGAVAGALLAVAAVAGSARPAAAPPAAPVAWPPDPASLLFFVAAVVTGPLAEEVFFRGLMLRAATSSWGRPLLAVAVTSALFALPHYLLTGLALAPFVLGSACSVVQMRGGGLRAAVALHGTFNAVSLSLFLRHPAPLVGGAVLFATGAAILLGFRRGVRRTGSLETGGGTGEPAAP